MTCKKLSAHNFETGLIRNAGLSVWAATIENPFPGLYLPPTANANIAVRFLQIHHFKLINELDPFPISILPSKKKRKQQINEARSTNKWNPLSWTRLNRQLINVSTESNQSNSYATIDQPIIWTDRRIKKKPQIK